MSKKSILWLAPYVPYDRVKHAGGKNMNYYINFMQSTGYFDIYFIGLAYEDERADADLEKKGIASAVYYRNNSKFDYVLRRMVSIFTILNPWTRYYQLLLLYEHIQLRKRIIEYREKGREPDLIILHWTAMGLLLPEMKKLFPNAKYIIIEEDVTYLGYKRKFEAKTTTVLKYRYEHLKNDELKVINDSDLTVTLNEKDRQLLIADGVPPDKVFACALYTDNYSDVIRTPKTGNLIFYGSMERRENYVSAIWFIENVMTELIDEANADAYKLYVIGSKPVQKLLDVADTFNKRAGRECVVVTGFVEDIRPYLSDAMCMVAPLLLGAGIKAKVIEAMSAGLPVLTNKIGIEGIHAQNGEEYLHCETVEEYISSIKRLYNDLNSENIEVDRIGKNAKSFIYHNFDIDLKLEQLFKKIKEII